jgi:hypothetical protein
MSFTSWKPSMTAEEQKSLLVRVVIKLALKLLKEKGFYPFGAVLGTKRNVQIFMPKGWKPNSTRDELEAYWFKELRRSTATGDYVAACFCADVRVPVNAGNLVPAMLVHIEHAEASAEDGLYPYLKDQQSKVSLGSPTFVVTAPQIFVSSAHSDE